LQPFSLSFALHIERLAMHLRSNMHRQALKIGLSVPLLVLGCAHDQKPEPRVAEPMIVPPKQPRAVYAPEPGPSTAVLLISASVREKCALPEQPSAEPQFDFDEAALRPRGEDILDRIATCMREGSLKDQAVTVVGHADPRGGEHYNLDLGMDRARAARDYLIKQGVASSAVQLETRGEQDATGTSPEGYQLDRRVEIEERAQRTQ
jgi:outer membrane protein OmpA-like peptidoglycan-associated protein